MRARLRRMERIYDMKNILSTIWRGIDALARAVIRLIGKLSPKLGGLCESLWNNTELVTYLFAGVATTVVNYAVYCLVRFGMGVSLEVSNICAWVVAVAFGYAVNKAFVFHTHCDGALELLREAGGFFAMRLVSLGAEILLLKLFVQVLGLNEPVMKLVTNIVVIILNYVFSKLFIFKKKA